MQPDQFLSPKCKTFSWYKARVRRTDLPQQKYQQRLTLLQTAGRRTAAGLVPKGIVLILSFIHFKPQSLALAAHPAGTNSSAYLGSEITSCVVQSE